ncbi:hypothetical protein [Rhizobium phage RHph_X3_2]|nr:hypothetical protein [Rhizobium phage RHph_X3_2]
MAALTYPFSLPFLADLLEIETVTFDLERNDAVSGQGTGQTIGVELAPPLWFAEVSLTPDYLQEAEIIAAKFRALRGVMGTFYLYDPRKKFPMEDPTGSILGASTITITAKGANNDTLSLSGFPIGYKLTPGDKFSLAYGASFRYFGEFSDYATANGAGVITAVPVLPHIPLAVSIGTELTLKTPFCKMALDVKGWNPGSSSGLHTGGQKFRAIQKV